MTTIRDVARLAGVAVSTVSLAFNAPDRVSERTAGRVRAAADSLGYRANPVARSLKSGRSRLIGMVLSDIGNPFFSRLLRSMERYANAHDYLVVVADTDGDPDRERLILEQFARQRVAAVLLAPCGRDAASTAHVRDLSMPAVLFDQLVDIEGSAHGFVGTDNVLASAMLTEHLLRLGHVRIGFLAGSAGHYTTAGRTRGYVDTLASAGIEADPALVLDARYSAEGGYEQTMRMLTSRTRPTALLASNNVMALGALQAIRDLGHDCPGDVSLVGIDEVPWMDMISPRITRVVQPIEPMAETAVELLLAQLAALERVADKGSPSPPAEELRDAVHGSIATPRADAPAPDATRRTIRLFSPTLVPGTSTARLAADR